MNDPHKGKRKISYPQWRLLKRIHDSHMATGEPKLLVSRYDNQTIRSLHRKGCIAQFKNQWAMTQWGHKILSGKGRVRDVPEAS
jgi:hypothetical protein